MPIIETKNLCYTYGQNTGFQKSAINDVNISIEKGEFIGLIGQTGSGKSTLIQNLNGLLKPTSGTVLLEDKDIWRKPKEIRKIRFKVGMVFQYPEYQLFEDTVYKDIEFGPTNMGLDENEINIRVTQACAFAGVDNSLINKSPFELSGGEKRKVAIAGVIAMDPEVLILDEPTAGLDPRGRRSLLDKISAYHKKRKNTIIFVSHNMEDVAALASRIIVMDKGCIKMFDTPKNVFSNADELEKIGLRVPHVTQLMQKIKDRGYNINSGILTMDDAVNELLNVLNKKGKTR